VDIFVDSSVRIRQSLRTNGVFVTLTNFWTPLLSKSKQLVKEYRRVLKLSGRITLLNSLVNFFLCIFPCYACSISAVTSYPGHQEKFLAKPFSGTVVQGIAEYRPLCKRLLRAESDCGYCTELVAACAARRHLFTPEREQAGWGKLLEDIRLLVRFSLLVQRCSGEGMTAPPRY
jgi:hypothetical protein